jgi:hypothetical protein
MNVRLGNRQRRQCVTWLSAPNRLSLAGDDQACVGTSGDVTLWWSAVIMPLYWLLLDCDGRYKTRPQTQLLEAIAAVLCT